MASKTITVTLPEDVARAVQAKIESGEYANESAVICQSLVEFVDNNSGKPSWMTQEEFKDWLRREAVPVLDKMDADPSRGRSAAQVLEHLEHVHKSFQKAG
jgi:Arc/MetJ-type ribon-helix-helix transcriptional regulator